MNKVTVYMAYSPAFGGILAQVREYLVDTPPNRIVAIVPKADSPTPVEGVDFDHTIGVIAPEEGERVIFVLNGGTARQQFALTKTALDVGRLEDEARIYHQEYGTGPRQDPTGWSVWVLDIQEDGAVAVLWFCRG